MMKGFTILAVFMTIGLVAANEADKYSSVPQNVNSGMLIKDYIKYRCLNGTNKTLNETNHRLELTFAVVQPVVSEVAHPDSHPQVPAGHIVHHVVPQPDQPMVVPTHEQPNVVVGHYSPNVMSADGMVKPAINKDQYGQPESASMPPGYKSFGSWGLYIGGNPADGYYSNYYKSIDNKPQVSGEPYKMVNQPVASFSPIVKQSGVSGGDYYPFAYSPAELNSGVPVHSSVSSYSPVGVSSYSAGVVPAYPSSGVSSYPPVGVASYQPNGVPVSYAQVSPAVEAPVAGVPSYSSADFYATKKIGKEVSKVNQQQQPQSSVKGGASHHQQQQQQAKGYSAFSGRSSHVYSQPQVVSYSVPVSSQIVGSQPGADGAFSPYGIHASTRYAVKPAVVSSSSYYQGMPVGYDSQIVSPGYKQQVYSSPQVGYYPMNYYGYPINQIHSSVMHVAPVVPSSSVSGSGSGSVVTEVQHQPAQAPQSPVQVGHAAVAQASPASPSMESQSMSQEQVVDKQEVDKSGVKQ